ncbi:hypothetical protein [Spirosoma endophyticum]|uniref:Transglycosylase SLT domain-containing protein n=1 Tax=Spirosoma endophyticum TaxID=662367 RepID=A0A1I1UA14_9BACT|nr:hypothetical protein [Spirosoma endophyticum]SFD67609.1 hypothetical protein SAMN05216167_106185 [Spirosoma endophyticum]
MALLAYEVESKFSSANIAKIKAIASRLGVDPNWLMIVFRFESANTFLPSVRNKNSGAVGLIQFTTVAIKGWNVTLDQLAKMTVDQQLDYVEKYLSPYKGKMVDLYNLYLAVFAPAYIGRPNSQKVYASPSNAYTSNKSLDTNNDGIITVGEIKEVITRYIPTGYSSGVSTLTEVAQPLPLALILIVLLILYFLLKRN